MSNHQVIIITGFALKTENTKNKALSWELNVPQVGIDRSIRKSYLSEWTLSSLTPIHGFFGAIPGCHHAMRELDLVYQHPEFDST